MELAFKFTAPKRTAASKTSKLKRFMIPPQCRPSTPQRRPSEFYCEQGQQRQQHQCDAAWLGCRLRNNSNLIFRKVRDETKTYGVSVHRQNHTIVSAA